MDTKLFHAAKGCEQSVQEEKGIELMESAFQGALKMISDIFGSFALLMREDSRKVCAFRFFLTAGTSFVFFFESLLFD